MVQRSRGLSRDALDAIAELERRVLAVDGGRLKLEWTALRTRPNDRVNDVLWWDGARLVGFCGMYVFGGEPEVTGMVDPQVRRQGIGTALLDTVGALCHERDIGKVLLVVPRSPIAGRKLALARGGTLDHSEHALLLTGEPTDGPGNPRVTLRPASARDAETVGAILSAAFSWTPQDLPSLIARTSRHERTLVIEHDGRPVGTVRITHDDDAGTDTGAIYGFAVHPTYQGRGIGRDVLRRCCRLLRQEGSSQVRLEVEVENERALRLYTDAGFRPVTTEDYYTLTLQQTASPPNQPHRATPRECRSG